MTKKKKIEQKMKKWKVKMGPNGQSQKLENTKNGYTIETFTNLKIEEWSRSTLQNKVFLSAKIKIR